MLLTTTVKMTILTVRMMMTMMKILMMTMMMEPLLASEHTSCSPILPRQPAALGAKPLLTITVPPSVVRSKVGPKAAFENCQGLGLALDFKG